ncbi:hypothetical protein EV383_4503 [Pseudonocardia sediminis]|uniref:Uncharacterized protein n=1 Tax=Pseudonocardia sediminis TaxID=1397368 RepID=A0A4Q7UZI9_PSEST|nr:hypothetical protein [Pseudonocardia sediminis]RZT87577.1 hypothetical protein EV383_4503 [Pseudonocardia sediminis]
MSFWKRLLGRENVPEGVAGGLADDEHVVAQAELAGGGHLVVTSWGLWLPEEPPRRLGWHEIAKAAWNSGTLEITASTAREVSGPGTVVLTDERPRRYRLDEPGKIPQAVHERVTGSIRSRSHRDLPGGGAWVLQRKVPGRDGLILQIRPDPGTDPDAVDRLAEGVAARIGGNGGAALPDERP